MIPTPRELAASDREWLDSLAGDAFREAREHLGERVRETPMWAWSTPQLGHELPALDRLYLKLELFQVTGTFKARGALLNALAVADPAAGVTAVSAGNHAIAVSWAASVVGTSAKVVMPQSASPIRIDRCRRLGAEVCLARDVHEAFELVARIERDEGRTFIHPFEGRLTLLGTGTLGWEIGSQLEDIDWLVVPIGGGGLIAGVATAVKLRQPSCRVIGVEPMGADSMKRSLEAGSPQSIDRVDTIADSLGAPHAAPLSFALCQRSVDEVVLIEDDEMRQAMRLLFDEAKLAVEPAGAAATAAILGPLRERIGGRVVSLVCGSNIDADTFHRHLEVTGAG